MSIPSSLLQKKKRGGKHSHRDISNLILLQNNPNLLQECIEKLNNNNNKNDDNHNNYNNNGTILSHSSSGNKNKLHPQHQKYIENRSKKHRKNDTIDDFITLYLIKWKLIHLITATSLLIHVMDDEQYINNYIQTTFSNETPIYLINNGIMNELSFKRYYEMIYQSAIETFNKYSFIKININNNDYQQQNKQDDYFNDDNNDITKEEDEKQIIRLLRACFVIAFNNDQRIKRFVMSYNSYQSGILFSKPPDIQKVNQFINGSYQHIEHFLQHQLEYSILDMIKECVDVWMNIIITT